MAGQSIQLHFPQLGVMRRFGFHQEGQQSQYGTPYSLNVRGEDPDANRLRGGSFIAAAPLARPETIFRDRSLSMDGIGVLASRVGSHNDTKLSSDVTDMLRPTLFQFSEAGTISGSLLALVPHKDQSLLAFTDNQTWVHQGDPLSGSRGRVSDQVGISGSNAWCVAHDTVYFLSKLGLYSVSASGGELTPLSEDRIPQELINLTGTGISLDYDHARRGVLIHLPQQPSWFYDIARGAFWPFNRTTNQSHVLIGPLRIGRPEHYGRILDLHGVIGESETKTPVTWRIVPGATAEAAGMSGRLAILAAVTGNNFDPYVAQSGSWSPGRSHRSYPRTRAIWCCLWLSATVSWSWEAVTMTRIESGKWR